jgi:hypothetical protein
LKLLFADLNDLMLEIKICKVDYEK